MNDDGRYKTQVSLGLTNVVSLFRFKINYVFCYIVFWWLGLDLVQNHTSLTNFILVPG